MLKGWTLWGLFVIECPLIDGPAFMTVDGVRPNWKESLLLVHVAENLI
jgi:hypothetical protein